MYITEYVPPTVTVDAVMMQLIDGVLYIGLINRGQEPFKGHWALPGGYSAEGKTTLESLEAVVKRKTGIAISTSNHVEQLYTFDTVARDPRGHAVSVTYMSCNVSYPDHSTGSEKMEFFPIDALPKLAYDHEEIIKYAHKRIRAKVGYTNVMQAFLDTKFTLTELQSAYEAVLGRPLDKRNFRKKFMQLDMIKETSEFKREGAHRPAKLYIFKQSSLQMLERNFE